MDAPSAVIPEQPAIDWRDPAVLPAALVVPACVALREAVLVLRAHGAKGGGGTRAAPDAPPGYRPVGEPVVGTGLG